MLEGNNQVIKTANGVEFLEAGRTLEKSKLTVNYLSIPIVPTLQFRNHRGRKTFRIGAGGYAGIRLGSHTKVKYEDSNNKIKYHERGNFYLNDFRYGLMGQIGIRWLTIFAKYDLNSLFAESKGPDLHTISFGLTFFDF